MFTGIWDFTVKQNATFRRTLTLTKADGTPIDMTGHTAAMAFRRAITSPVLATMSTANGGIVLGGLAGTVALYLPAATTATFVDSLIHDFKLVGADGSVAYELSGRAFLRKAVTRT